MKREELVDELAEILDRFHLAGPRKQRTEILAAGYRKPRTITTAEELEALFRSEANVVLLDEDGISLQNLAGGWQAATGSRRLMTSDLTFHCFGPTFTVLHEAQA